MKHLTVGIVGHDYEYLRQALGRLNRTEQIVIVPPPEDRQGIQDVINAMKLDAVILIEGSDPVKGKSLMPDLLPCQRKHAEKLLKDLTTAK